MVDYVCPKCGSRNTNHLEGTEYECYDCGQTYGAPHEYAFDAKLDVVIRAFGRTEEEARKEIEKLDSIDIAYDNGLCWITEGTAIMESLELFAVDSQYLEDREEPPSAQESSRESLLERIKKGPQPGQSKGDMFIDLGHASNQLHAAGSFGGAMLWGCLVAAYEKALGLPVTPKAAIGGRKFDFTTVKVNEKGFGLRLEETK